MRIAWNIYDQRLHELGQSFEDYRNAEAVGAIRHGGGIAELAAKTGLPAEKLDATLSQTIEMAHAETETMPLAVTSQPNRHSRRPTMR